MQKRDCMEGAPRAGRDVKDAGACFAPLFYKIRGIREVRVVPPYSGGSMMSGVEESVVVGRSKRFLSY